MKRVGASSAHGRQDAGEEIFTVTLHTHHVVHAVYVQEMGRDEDLRSFITACPYEQYSTWIHISSTTVNMARRHIKT